MHLTWPDALFLSSLVICFTLIAILLLMCIDEHFHPERWSDEDDRG